ncbi:hypothetical protein K9L67_04075 [Candidatus Woesearchaeota archaeon]|nr:hypothetical protein [Candidatus Woesearchaeota archaeon]MCF7901379.1 hypothetical protein [Candidatus Woesearchaeota archaeon]MCF8013150.1 hypothetical protein [Candidatus Woesearchaeota archaeon]
MQGVQLFCGPEWFNGFDAIIDLFSLIVLILIAVYAFKVYRLHEKKSLKYMAGAMSLIAVAFIFKIITYGVFYLRDNFALSYSNLANVAHGFTCSNMSFILLFMIYALITLVGLFMLLYVYQKEKSMVMLFLVFYLIVISLFLTSSAYYVLHLSALIISVLITIQFFMNYKKNKLKSTKYLYLSFIVYSLSHVFFLLSYFSTFFYFLAELIQLVAFIGLLYTFISVLNHGKKKR